MIYEETYEASLSGTYTAGGIEVVIPFAYRVVRAYPVYAEGTDAKLYNAKVVGITGNRVKIQLFTNYIADRDADGTLGFGVDGDEWSELADGTSIDGFKVVLKVFYEV